MFDFLTLLDEEASILGMTEAQAYLAMPHLITRTEANQFLPDREGHAP